MNRKPLIGITKPDREDFFSYLAIKMAVWFAGGSPMKITPKNKNYESVNIDGLILGGGKDIFPGLYNQSPKEDYVYDKVRDEMEVFWAERARAENIPTLGICRGAQLMNIVCSGSIHMSVKEAYEDANYPDGIIHNALYRKQIIIKPNTMLHTVLGRDDLMVNSIHKQAIADLGKNMQVNAIENNGVIQSIALANHPFFLGVQFHPEFLIHQKIFRKIFEALVVKAEQRAA